MLGERKRVEKGDQLLDAVGATGQGQRSQVEVTVGRRARTALWEGKADVGQFMVGEWESAFFHIQ